MTLNHRPMQNKPPNRALEDTCNGDIVGRLSMPGSTSSGVFLPGKEVHDGTEAIRIP